MFTKVVSLFNKEIEIPVVFKRSFLLLFFSYLTFCGALIKIYLPVSPIPFTLQNLMLFISVYYLNSKEIGLSQALYILAGYVGLPVFAAGLTGMAAFVGPTAGYLIGFIIAGIFISYIYNRNRQKTFWRMFFIFMSGAIIILLSGTLHLAFIYGIGLKKAIVIGFLPFLITDTIKVLIASSFYKVLK
jgi:biotin transport system substrate-specific component